MQRELTISIDEQVFRDLHQVIGPEHISRFIETLIRPRLQATELEAGYRAMAADEAHEANAMDWSEAIVTDVAAETR